MNYCVTMKAAFPYSLRSYKNKADKVSDHFSMFGKVSTQSILMDKLNDQMKI